MKTRGNVVTISSVNGIAAAVAFLGSDDAAWITGHTLPVEGGVLTGPNPIDLRPPDTLHKRF